MALSGGRPQLKELLDQLKEVTEWEVLGFHLGIKPHKLTDIKSGRGGNLTLCKMDMFDFWLRSDVHASWEKVARVLEQMDLGGLAQTLRTAHGLAPSSAAAMPDPMLNSAMPVHAGQSGGGGGSMQVGSDMPARAAVQESGAVQTTNLTAVINAIASNDVDVNAVNPVDPYKQSLLQGAVQKRDLNSVKALIALGAEVNHLDGNGCTALDAALKMGSTKVAELLKAVGGLPAGSLTPPSSTMEIEDSEEEMRPQTKTMGNVLCLDSSVEKVVVQLEVLHRLELTTGKKVTEMFEYVVGSGIGGLLLLAMVYASKSVSQVQRMYYQLWQNLKRIPDTKKRWRELEDFAHDLFKSTRMEDVVEPKVLIAAVNRETTRLKLQFFTNFARTNDGRDLRLHVYRVAGYTCATPEYYNIDTDQYIHGGAICGNLTASALSFIAENCSNPTISGVASVGEGIWSAVNFTDETDLAVCVADALAEQVHENCKWRFASSPTFYYRINPLFPLQTPPVLRDLEALVDLHINTIMSLVDDKAAKELMCLSAELKV